MRKLTIKGTLANEPVQASVSILPSDEWYGFRSFVRAYHSEAGRDDEYLIVYYTDVCLKTPHNYEIKINRRSGSNYHWSCGNGDSALTWLKKRRAEFGLVCASVEVDSIRRIITITVNRDAEIIEDDIAKAIEA